MKIMAITHAITLLCGHKLSITAEFLAYDVITCRVCLKTHKFPRQDRQRVAREAGWGEDRVRDPFNELK